MYFLHNVSRNYDFGVQYFKIASKVVYWFRESCRLFVSVNRDHFCRSVETEVTYSPVTVTFCVCVCVCVCVFEFVVKNLRFAAEVEDQKLPLLMMEP